MSIFKRLSKPVRVSVFQEFAVIGMSLAFLGCSAAHFETQSITPAIVLQNGRAYVFTLQVVSVKSVFLKTEKEMTLVTKSIPPRYGYKIKGYVYGIELTVVALTDASYWDQPFVLHYRLPDGDEKTVIFNKERFAMRADFQYSFFFTVKTKERRGRISCRLGFFMHSADDSLPVIKPRQWMVDLN